jgi:penicillin-binding protein 2
MPKRRFLGISFINKFGSLSSKRSFQASLIDELSKVTPSSGHFKNHNNPEWKDLLLPNFNPDKNILVPSTWRPVFLACLTILAFFAIFIRLFHLQVVRGQENRNLADGNRIQIRTIHAPRGVIFDRNNKILAQNNPGFRLVEKQPNGETRFRYVSREDTLALEVRNDPLFDSLEVDSIRLYPLGEKTAHVLGYVGEITAEELSDPMYKEKYQQGDRIGRGGVEETYESILKGVDGGEVIEVDAQGKKLRTLRQVEAIPGQNLVLSIDAQLQRFAYDQLDNQIKKVGSCCGALVIQDPQSGQILSLVSIPSFNPKDLTSALNSPNSPILNRVIAGVYPPGSTFKIASSLAGLASGKITPSTVFEDTGQVDLGPFKFTNWYFTQYGKTEGAVDMVKALQRSNDTYYYRMSLQTGEKLMGEVAKKLGMGKKLGIDVPGEETGLVPDNEWKQKQLDEVWYPGDTLHLSIGQGFLLTTPLQISNLVSAIAADGKIYTPHLAVHAADTNGNLTKEFKFPETEKLFKSEEVDVIKKGLELVPQNGGTAWPFFNFPIKTAGKTGTAEFGDPKDRTHAWYTSYAPLEDPRIAITVLIEAGGEGSTHASPVAKEIYRYYFSEDKNDLIKDIGIVASDSARILGE